MNYKRAIAVLAAAFLTIPTVAAAFPFGGMIGQIIFCYNNAIYAAVGPPRGGPYIWTPSTRTYQFGPPAHVGQWLLGLAAPPYYCLVSIQPIIVWSGILMTMEGSSGPAAPVGPGGGLGNYPGGGSPSPSPTPPGTPPSPPPAPTHVLVSEVYPHADAAHGGQIEDEWLELYNPTNASVNISRWTVRTAQTSQTLPDNTTLQPNSYLVFAGTTNVRSLWNISSNVPVTAFSNAFAGFVSAGDHVYLQNSAGTRIDAMSYGSDTTGFSPSTPAVAIGHSIVRKNLTSDSDTAQDWTDTAAPTPGR